MATSLTFHLVPKAYYDGADASMPYAPQNFQEEGFIHCTDGVDNLIEVGDANFKRDPQPYLLLVIDKAKVRPSVVYEDPQGIYPHIYGPLNRDAIVGVVPLRRAEDGSFLVPDLRGFEDAS